MTRVEDLIARAREKGLGLAVADGKLKVTAPKDRDTELDSLLHELRQHKAELVVLLSDAAPPCWNCGATMTETRDIFGRDWWACWSCARTI